MYNDTITNLRYVVFTVLKVYIVVFQLRTLYKQLGGYQHLKGTYCLQLQAGR
jgi:hypothetical protein